MSRVPRPTGPARERILACGVRFTDQAPREDEDLGEATGLVQAAGGEVVGPAILQRKQRPDPATLFGRGKVDEIRLEIERFHPDAVVVDNELTPAQGRNLEKAWSARVIDRSELILDIFAHRARSRQARLQVELAQNEYLAPRLRRMWTHLERNEGAIGTRGPGETQLETDKRLIRRRIQELQAELRTIEERKLREVKTRAGEFTIGLVGYTNAGKSTLLNRLTGSQELAVDMLFATLDTRTRQWRLSDGRTVLLSDTVGFVQRLPHHLVASFHATLEEAIHADLLVHVVDVSHPRAQEQMEAVDAVLAQLLRAPRDRIVAFNKLDRVADPLRLAPLLASSPYEHLTLSAANGVGLETLDYLVRARLDARSELYDVWMSAGDGRLAARIRALCTPIEEEHDGERGRSRLRVRLDPGQLGSLRRAALAEARFELVVDPASHEAGTASPQPDVEPGDRISAAGP